MEPHRSLPFLTSVIWSFTFLKICFWQTGTLWNLLERCKQPLEMRVVFTNGTPVPLKVCKDYLSNLSTNLSTRWEIHLLLALGCQIYYLFLPNASPPHLCYYFKLLVKEEMAQVWPQILTFWERNSKIETYQIWWKNIRNILDSGYRLLQKTHMSKKKDPQSS